MEPITSIEEGQPFVDDPIRVRPIPCSRIEQSVALAFNPLWEPRQAITVGHERVQLRWMEPDGKGGLRPKSFR